MNLSKLKKAIRERLVKRLTAYDYYVDKNNIYYELQLQNFWTIKKKVEVFLHDGPETFQLPFIYEKNKLTVSIPCDLACQLKHKSSIEIFINNKKMWIGQSESFADKNRAFTMDGRYFISRVDKNIFLSSDFTEYHFSNTKVKLESLIVNERSIQFGLVNYNLDEIEFYAFQNQKMHLLEAHIDKDRKEITLDNFALMSNGLWRVFLRSKNNMHPLQLVDDQRKLTFASYHHKICVVLNNADFYLNFQPHFFQSDSVLINKDEDELISIHFKTDCDKEETFLIIEDTKSREETRYKMHNVHDGLSVSIPLNDLWKDYSRKRFFIDFKGETPKKYQLLLSKSQISGSGIEFEETVNSQVVIFSFYVRKDQSLGFRTLRPVLKKEITHIDDFKIKGFVGSLKAFIDCRAFLVFEERETLANKKVPIENEFEIDIKNLDLVELKSKDKTIIDLYVEIINQDNEIIRKEKIKYKYADYKKDNYYDHTVVRDVAANSHHFLITTTPFNNLKIETFSIPSIIHIPEDTSQKDNNIWLIGERYNTAQDNGIVLHQWLREHTDVQSYYVIEQDSLDYEQVKEDPYVLVFGSQKHYEIAFKAGVLLGTHDLENILPYKTAKGFFHYEDTYKVFLQHGVLGRKNVEYHKKYYDVPFDLFIVSSDPEKYDIVVDKMGYEEHEVGVTGLARFDRLIQKEKPKDILLMPTWRDWINTDQQFLESEYYSAYMNLIESEELQQLLEQYNIYLHFYPHYRAQDFFQRNVDINNSRVKFIPFGSRKVQELLIEHALLITDYSTVSFDFIKMDKPVIHYHFDVGRFFRRGILRPIEETFIGGIAHTEEEMINLIKDRLNHDLENFEIDISGVIKYQDRHNCERIYTSVCNELKEKNGTERTF
ncbi:minor teichoic acid biosynthesis protein [Bacillus freudenreichii]|nr:minor teichoic acid biosynthesis protein [Bacillus freudenreichii]